MHRACDECPWRERYFATRAAKEAQERAHGRDLAAMRERARRQDREIEYLRRERSVDYGDLDPVKWIKVAALVLLAVAVLAFLAGRSL